MELFPGWLFGKTWAMDNKSGYFRRQANGPGYVDKNERLSAAVPMAQGKILVVAPEEELLRITIRSHKESLQLLDGRYMHNNGWFVVRSLVMEGATKNAIEWIITPNCVKDWKSNPVIHVSQIGYLPGQEKVAIIELDKKDTNKAIPGIYKIDENGKSSEVLNQRQSHGEHFSDIIT